VDTEHDFITQREGSAWITIHRSLAQDPIVKTLGDPDHFFDTPECEVVKDQRKIKVARVRLLIRESVKTIYLKRYNAFSWRYRFASLFQLSGAKKSLAGATILAESGLRTVYPLAAVESRHWGLLNKSFFLSEEIEGGKTADTYWKEEIRSLKGKDGLVRRREFLRGLGDLFRLLHSQNIYHNDLKDANILVAPHSSAGNCFYLLDLEGIRRYRKLNRRRRIKNLVQLNRTLGKYLRPKEKAIFLKSYFESSNSNRMTKRNCISSVLKLSNRLDHIRGLRTSDVVIKGEATNDC